MSVFKFTCHRTVKPIVAQFLTSGKDFISSPNPLQLNSCIIPFVALYKRDNLTSGNFGPRRSLNGKEDPSAEIIMTHEKANLTNAPRTVSPPDRAIPSTHRYSYIQAAL